MVILVVGATGATGKLLVEQLLHRDLQVRAVVRSTSRVPEHIRSHDNLELIEASLLDLTDAELQELVKDCTAIASCLGHNLSFKGLFGPPFRLVRDAARRLSTAAIALKPVEPVKYVLMNTTGNPNRDIPEKWSFAERLVIGILRVLLPPQADNEAAANYLRLDIGQNHPSVEWVAVRPDSLIDEPEVSQYSSHPSPTRSGIFDPGKTSRINVAHFMAELIIDADLWSTWKGQMPVIYNVEE